MNGMPQIKLSPADEATLELVDDVTTRRVIDVFGDAERASAAVAWAESNLPADEANALTARLSDPNQAQHAAAELQSLYASGVRDSVIKQSANNGGYAPHEIKAATERAAAGDPTAIRRLKQTPGPLIDEALGLPTGPGPGLLTI